MVLLFQMDEKRNVMEPEDKQNSVEFGCHIEPEKNWSNEVALLIHSLRKKGGRFRDSRFNLFVASDMSQYELPSRLNGVTIRLTPRFQTNPYLNKINILKYWNPYDSSSHLLMLDHDTIILSLSGLEQFLDRSVRARQNYKYGLTNFGRNYTELLDKIAGKNWSRIHYFNTGVILVHRDLAHLLYESWEQCSTRLFATPNIKNCLAEQAGFALALSKRRIPYGFLPPVFNQINWKILRDEAHIIHYNDYDLENSYIKSEIFRSLSRFFDYLERTKNMFWRKYSPIVQELNTRELKDMARALWTIISCRICLG